MISNLPTLTARNVTVEIDTALAESQMSRITDVMQNKEYHLSVAERAALDGVRNLLAAMIGAPVVVPREPTRRIAPEDINRIRDLFMLGKSANALAHQFGYRTLAVSRMLDYVTYRDHVYEPSEFAPKNVAKWYGTNKFAWLEPLTKERADA